MSRWKITAIVVSLLVVVVGLTIAFLKPGISPGASSAQGARPALTVTTTRPEPALWPDQLTATGTVQPWQESIIGPEIGGLRLTEVLVNVGDHVKKGALLARFSDEMVRNGVLQQEAALDDAKAKLAEAQLNAKRAEQLKSRGFISEQEAQKFETNVQIAEAQVKLTEAKLEAEKIKYGYTKVLAQDDGVISSRTATVGTVVQNGAEMFRLIRQGRLEWRAELPEQLLRRVRVGQKVSLHLAKDEEVAGKVARISPVIDLQSRNGTIYVDLPPSGSIRSGMFAQGEFDLGKSNALTVPQNAVVVRDGFSYVFGVGSDNRVEQVKVTTGRRIGDRVEITSGLKPDAVIVALGAGFLTAGDLVRIENPTTVSPATTSSQATQNGKRG